MDTDFDIPLGQLRQLALIIKLVSSFADTQEHLDEEQNS